MRQLRLCTLIVTLVCLWAVPTSATITSNSSASRCEATEDSCPAPLAIFFEAEGATCADDDCDDAEFDNESFHKLSYKWTFGDEKGETWIASGQNKNIEYGPLAAHVFDDSGTYSVTLEIWSNTETYSATEFTIYVDDPDTVFAGTDTLCVADGTTPVQGVGGCPSGAAVLDEDDVDDAIETAINTDGRHRVLFKAGDTFTVNDISIIEEDGPGIIGSYGAANGGKATFDGLACNCTVFKPDNNPIDESGAGRTDDWVFMDLEILQDENDIDAKIVFEFAANIGDPSRGNDSSWENVLFYRIDRPSGNSCFIQGGTGQARSVVNGGSLSKEGVTGLFIVEVNCAGWQNQIYVATQYGAILGSSVSGAPLPIGGTGTLHLFRIGSSGRWGHILIAHNQFLKHSTLSTTIRCDHDEIPILPCEFMVFRGNYHEDTHEDSTSSVNVGFEPMDPTVDHRLRDIIIENNLFEVKVHTSAKTTTIRNNIFTLYGSQPHGTINVGDTNGRCNLAGWCDDFMVYNNSAVILPCIDLYDTGGPPQTSGNPDGDCDIDPTESVATSDDSFNMLKAVSVADMNWWFTNNVYWNVGTSSDVESSGACTGGGTCADNIGPDTLASSPFADSTPEVTMLSDWYLTGPSASDAIGQGTDLGFQVHRDMEGKIRPGADSLFDIGAFELDGIDESAGQQSVGASFIGASFN